LVKAKTDPMNKMILNLLLLLLMTSCAILKNDPNRQLSSITKTDSKKLEGEFANYPTTFNRKVVRELSGENYPPLTLWSLITREPQWSLLTPEPQRRDSIDRLKGQMVTLAFSSKKKIVAKLFDNGKLIKSENVRGRIKNGYFYYGRHFMFIPFFPLIYRHDFDKHRIGLSTKNSLVVDYVWNWYVFAIIAGDYSKGRTYAEFIRK